MKNFRYDVVLTVGKYAGIMLNAKPLTLEQADRMSHTISQQGCPQVRFNSDTTRDAMREESSVESSPPLSSK